MTTILATCAPLPRESAGQVDDILAELAAWALLFAILENFLDAKAGFRRQLSVTRRFVDRAVCLGVLCNLTQEQDLTPKSSAQ